MKRSVLSALALLAVVAPTAALAQNEYEQQVLDILSEVSSFAIDQGYSQTGDKFVAALGANEAEDHYIDLVDGRDYVIVAVCDVDCSDIDLHLYSPDDDIVGADEEPDDVPVIELAYVGGGRHRLEVGMFTCSQEPCFYAVGVYTKEGSGGGEVAGGDAYVEQVRAILDAFSEAVAEQGYTATGEDWVSALGASETEEQVVTLGGGADYAIVAVCDEDCDDMDLAVYDPNGNMVDEDVESDANPVLEINGARSGQYRVEVRMYQCSSEPCYYAMGLYKRVREEWIPVEVPLLRR